MSNEVFRERLQKMRERRRISRIVLAELCGLAPDAVRRYEKGEAEPKLKALIALADYFEITIDFLVGHEKDR